MGANGSKTISQLTNKIDNELSQTLNTSANTECIIANGDLRLKGMKNCKVTNSNRCGASASAVMDATISAALDAFNSATTAQKTSIFPGFNANSTQQDIKNLISNKIKQTCNSDANTRLAILNKNIYIEDCEDSIIENINVGDSAASCGIRAVIDQIATTSNETKNKQATGLLTMMNPLVMGGGAIGSIICSCCCCCLLMVIVIAIAMSTSK